MEWNKVQIDGISEDTKNMLDGMETDEIVETFIIPIIERMTRASYQLLMTARREEEEIHARHLRARANWLKRYADYIMQRAESDWKF